MAATITCKGDLPASAPGMTDVVMSFAIGAAASFGMVVFRVAHSG
ncbi:hypothetical protein [Reyranella sp.]|nr:hypothetical protein [Reyranella sp.]